MGALPPVRSSGTAARTYDLEDGVHSRRCLGFHSGRNLPHRESLKQRPTPLLRDLRRHETAVSALGLRLPRPGLGSRHVDGLTPTGTKVKSSRLTRTSRSTARAGEPTLRASSRASRDQAVVDVEVDRISAYDVRIASFIRRAAIVAEGRSVGGALRRRELDGIVCRVPSGRAQRRSFKAMPVWMRSGDAATIFRGALHEIAVITFDAANVDWEPPGQVYWDRDERMRHFGERLRAEAKWYGHVVDLIFDALDVAIRSGYEVDAAEALLADAITLHAAVRACDADEVYRLAAEIRPKIRALGYVGSA
jgi:hypothetical protein